MKKIKEMFQGKGGSAMVMAMIVLVNAMLIIVSLSLISISERKMSSKFKSSTPAFQAADSGVEYALKKIQGASPSDALITIFDYDSGKFAPKAGVDLPVTFELMLFDESGNPLAGADTAGDVRLVRSIGTVGTGENKATRAVEVAVAASQSLKVCAIYSLKAGADASNNPDGSPDKFVDYMPVPDSWNISDCKSFAALPFSNPNSETYYALGCKTDTTPGSNTINFGNGCKVADATCTITVPATNCGW